MLLTKFHQIWLKYSTVLAINVAQKLSTSPYVCVSTLPSTVESQNCDNCVVSRYC